MVVAMSHRLAPRPNGSRPSTRTSEQVLGERRRQVRLTLEAQLHDYYHPYCLPKELVFGGTMNKSVDRSDSVTGCELTGDFTSWLEDHNLIDPQEAARRRQFDVALARLYAEQPYAHLVISEHNRTGRTRIQLAEAWGHGNRRVNEAYTQGIELLLEYLAT